MGNGGWHRLGNTKESREAAIAAVLDELDAHDAAFEDAATRIIACLKARAAPRAGQGGEGGVMTKTDRVIL